jgi:integrative and conjugative element protein (TIGR02256 family)
MIHWFKKHPEFLRRESKALSGDSNYQEIHQSRNQLFISHGNIVVRLNQVTKFPFLIIYTNATPYKLPLVIPVKTAIESEDVEQISKLNLSEALEKLKSNIRFYEDLRHQNSSGDLCILEQENLDNGSQYYSISDILKRVRDWCAGHITNRYPPDSEELDYLSHFNNINQEIKIIYPEFFFNDKLIEGDCYSSLYRVIPAGIYFKHIKKIFYGSFIDGISEKGVIEQTVIKLNYPLHDVRIKTSLDIYTQKENVKKLIDDELLLKACWFQVEKEPRPFHLVPQLVEIIGDGDFENGIKRIAKRCSDSFNIIPKSFFIGLRFPNRRMVYEFQLFKLNESSNPSTYTITTDPIEKMRRILERYDQVEAIEGEKISEYSFHQRNSTRAHHEILKKISINILGVGALGSEIADCIAKAGVNEITLWDNQTFKVHNAVRHLAGLDHFSEPKVYSVAEILQNHNPFVNVYCNPFSLYDLDPNIHLRDDSLSISSVADDNVEGFINQQLVISNKPAFYIRALRGGKAARIIRVIPGKDACFNCLSLYRIDRLEFIEIPEDEDYPTIKNECNNPIRPASACDLKLIASMASRLIIDYLQADSEIHNNWIWSTEVISRTIIQEPFKLYAQNIKPHINCVYCHHEKKISIAIDQSTLEEMRGLIEKSNSVETGGVLAGFKDERGNLIIRKASGPGPKAVQTSLIFEKDIEFCQNFLNEIYSNSESKIVYVGEWHSHPSNNNKPSHTDLKSLSDISEQKDYLTEMPIMIIFSNTGNPSCTVHPFGKSYYFTELIVEDSQ